MLPGEIRMKQISDDLLFFLYLAIGVITFGHSWHKMLAIPIGPFPPELLLLKMIITILSGFMWPLYWSVWLWS